MDKVLDIVGYVSAGFFGIVVGLLVANWLSNLEKRVNTDVVDGYYYIDSCDVDSSDNTTDYNNNKTHYVFPVVKPHQIIIHH